MNEQQKELVKEMVSCNTYLIRNIEANTNLKFPTYGKVEEVMTKTKKNTTYKDAANNILEMATKHCKNDILLNRIEEMRKNILLNDLSDIKMLSHWNTRPQNELESELSSVITNTVIELNIGMYSLSEASETTGINNETIKQACQDGRLLNIRKVGRGWQVNLNEVKKYWNISEKEN
jgi:predicted site-specific integrase-resolvase